MTLLSVYISLVLVISGYNTITTIEAFVCPTGIWPCFCTTAPYSDRIKCDISAVTQESVNHAIAETRKVNNLTSDEWLVLDGFYLQYSPNITTFDWTPLSKIKASTIMIQYNEFLEAFVGPPIESNQGMLDVVDLYITNNERMTDATLGQTLKYFNGPAMKNLDLSRNILLAAEANVDTEFLPGLGAFVNLETFRFSENYVQRLWGGNFKTNNKLREIYFDWNQLKEIGENAFLFDETDEFLNSTLWIDLHLNPRLNENTFPQNHGLDTLTDRRVTLYVEYTGLTTLPQATFEKFMDAHEGNKLMLWMTQLVCDQRVKWLKERREEFESFVTGAECMNDPGYTIFTSNLV